MILGVAVYYRALAWAVYHGGWVIEANWVHFPRRDNHPEPPEYLLDGLTGTNGFLIDLVCHLTRQPSAVVMLRSKRRRSPDQGGTRIRQIVEDWFCKTGVPVYHLRPRKVYRWATGEPDPGSRLVLTEARFLCETPKLAQTIRFRPVGDAICAAAHYAACGVYRPQKNPRRFAVGTRRVYRPGAVYLPVIPHESALEILL